MRIAALLFALLLAGCSKPAWHMTDISGGHAPAGFPHDARTASRSPAQDFRGKVVALYFGYTHCPDVCPTTLANLTDMLAQGEQPGRADAVRHRRSRTATPMRCWRIMPRPFRPRWWACAARQPAGRSGPHLSRRLCGEKGPAL